MIMDIVYEDNGTPLAEIPINTMFEGMIIIPDTIRERNDVYAGLFLVTRYGIVDFLNPRLVFNHTSHVANVYHYKKLDASLVATGVLEG